MTQIVTQLTLRGMEPELELALRRLAKTERTSLNKAALKLIRRGAGLPEPGEVPGIGDGLDDWVGSMTAGDARAIASAVDELDRLSVETR